MFALRSSILATASASASTVIHAVTHLFSGFSLTHAEDVEELRCSLILSCGSIASEASSTVCRNMLNIASGGTGSRTRVNAPHHVTNSLLLTLESFRVVMFTCPSQTDSNMAGNVCHAMFRMFNAITGRRSPLSIRLTYHGD